MALCKQIDTECFKDRFHGYCFSTKASRPGRLNNIVTKWYFIKPSSLDVILRSKPEGVNIATSYPGSFHYASRFGKDPGPGWSRVSQILGDNNWDLWGVGKANVAFEFKTMQE